MSYSSRKLKFFVEDFHNNLDSSRQVAEQLCLAEDDGEWKELPALLHPTQSFFHNSFWGLARGPTAAAAVLAAEKKYVIYAWTTPLQPLTSRCFVRHGYVRVLPGCRQLLLQSEQSSSSSSSSSPFTLSGMVHHPSTTFRLMGAWASDMLAWTPFTVFSSMFSFMFQKKISEYIVVRDGKVVYRDVGYDWYMAKQ